VPPIGLADLARPHPASECSASFLGRNEAVLIKDTPMMQWLRELDRRIAGPAIDAARYGAEFREVWEWLTERNIVTTKAERLGLATIQAERGDKIAIRKGCNVPILLRPSSRGLSLVGASYIDGLMDEEALRDLGNIQSLDKLYIY